jgi:hypothetical protein
MEFADLLLGLGEEARDLSPWQMAARAVVVYLATLAIVRIGKKRFLSRASAFDVIVGIVIGSIASRAVTGNAPILPSPSPPWWRCTGSSRQSRSAGTGSAA